MNDRLRRGSVVPLLYAAAIFGCLSSEMDAFVFGFARILLHEVVQQVAFVIVSVFVAGFIVWFWRNAYQVELELREDIAGQKLD